MKKIAIIGYSGHALVVLDACKKADINVRYYCDFSHVENNPYDLIYLGDENNEQFDWNNIDFFVLGIGSNQIRRKVSKLIELKGKKKLNVIHPTSILNDGINIGTGNLIAANVVVNPFAQIGDDCIINTAAIIEHECKIGNTVHIAPGVVLAGNVTIGDGTFIGANSVIKQGVIIGENVTVGAGSVVLKNIPNEEVWVGNPAKKLIK
ncbi:acetyltransferase [Chryseobacterium populi]|uniref:Sugar O-acyltransferase, sialic acid O-acetyltransferase NeuD family n=1 Tax=Chryseobacterium populi TaxID=1144316 RepID=J2T9U3_9FLAO|nr:acetyltransferase [Chryseobacterium populi]EJL74897.1 sugar O-acyltransferase, sialic acid O-acetyltransferase NeuD family [Chryseobacterium populi]